MAMLLLVLEGCGEAGPAPELADRTRPVVRSFVADAEIWHSWDGCRFQIFIGDREFSPEAASRPTFEAFMGGVPRKSATLEFLPTGETTTITCSGFIHRAPALSIQSVAAR